MSIARMLKSWRELFRPSQVEEPEESGPLFESAEPPGFPKLEVAAESPQRLRLTFPKRTIFDFCHLLPPFDREIEGRDRLRWQVKEAMRLGILDKAAEDQSIISFSKLIVLCGFAGSPDDPRSMVEPLLAVELAEKYYRRNKAWKNAVEAARPEDERINLSKAVYASENSILVLFTKLRALFEEVRQNRQNRASALTPVGGCLDGALELGLTEGLAAGEPGGETSGEPATGTGLEVSPHLTLGLVEDLEEGLPAHEAIPEAESLPSLEPANGSVVPGESPAAAVTAPGEVLAIPGGEAAAAPAGEEPEEPAPAEPPPGDPAKAAETTAVEAAAGEHAPGQSTAAEPAPGEPAQEDTAAGEPDGDAPDPLILALLGDERDLYLYREEKYLELCARNAFEEAYVTYKEKLPEKPPSEDRERAGDRGGAVSMETMLQFAHAMGMMAGGGARQTAAGSTTTEAEAAPARKLPARKLRTDGFTVKDKERLIEIIYNCEAGGIKFDRDYETLEAMVYRKPFQVITMLAEKVEDPIFYA